MKKFCSIFLKGAFIGGTLSVPGVSGGSMAMILGIYEKLIQAVNILIGRGGEKKKAIGFLSLFSVGAIVGILGISGIVVRLLDCYPMQMVFFFSGAVAGGLPLIYREAKKENISVVHYIYLAIGVAVVVFLSILPKGLFQIDAGGGFWSVTMQFLGGVIAAIALVLPGISVSHMLYVLGLYKGIMAAIAEFDLIVLLPFVFGVSAGVLLSARGMNYLFDRFPGYTYFVILGFILGSIGELLSSALGAAPPLSCYPLMVLGFCSVYLISGKKKASV
ncbi:MAG: DUF368 domain-containing protein [Clostridia bacterium]|nr:DUF368 domain-containing protein [Clostridia bacterium]